MGTWGVGAFENDDAGDWVFELEECDDYSIVEEALDGGLGDSDSIESDQGVLAIAAAEVVAAANGKPANDLPEEVLDWLKGKPKPSDALRQKAIRAIDAVTGSGSELLELWEEAEPKDSTAWKQCVADLKSRLT